MKVLVIIPCYNEAENICRVVQRLKATCPDVDYLVVNDKVSEAAGEIMAILVAESCRTKNRMNIVEGV